MNKIIQFPSKKNNSTDSITEHDFERFKNTFVIPQRIHKLIQKEVLRQIQKKKTKCQDYRQIIKTFSLSLQQVGK